MSTTNQKRIVVATKIRIFIEVRHHLFRSTRSMKMASSPRSGRWRVAQGKASNILRATPWVIIYPRLLLLDQARVDSPRLIEELSSILESYSKGVAVGSRLPAPATRPLCPRLFSHGPSGHFHKSSSRTRVSTATRTILKREGTPRRLCFG